MTAVAVTVTECVGGAAFVVIVIVVAVADIVAVDVDEAVAVVVVAVVIYVAVAAVVVVVDTNDLYFSHLYSCHINQSHCLPHPPLHSSPHSSLHFYVHLHSSSHHPHYHPQLCEYQTTRQYLYYYVHSQALCLSFSNFHFSPIFQVDFALNAKIDHGPLQI